MNSTDIPNTTGGRRGWLYRLVGRVQKRATRSARFAIALGRMDARLSELKRSAPESDEIKDHERWMLAAQKLDRQWERLAKVGRKWGF